MVRTNTAVLPGADAAVVRIKETRRALAMTLDGNGRYCAANPREGTKLVMAEAARNIVCVGARPVAITNCLNFASPEKPEVMWSFSEVIDGMAEACNAFQTPVVSGNVSFYNETEGRGILPTPVIGMVGLIEDVRRVIQPGFKKEGDVIVLLGTTENDLALSEFTVVCGENDSSEVYRNAAVPSLDMQRELAVQKTCLEAAEAGLLQSAHDCSDGGLAVTLAESCFSSLGRAAIGAQIELESSFDATVSLFSESPSRIVVSVDPANLQDLERIAEGNGSPIALVGRVGGNALTVSVKGHEVLALEVSDLENAWRTSLSHKLEAEALAAGME
jgi:phosphoribosylformylglycinamidine synthase